MLVIGARDPYQITGNGAGFVMCWRGDVRWEIGRSADPKEFMKVDSEEYLLAIPDFSNQVRDEFDPAAPSDNKSVSSLRTYESAALFKKVIMKLSGKVRWLVGLMFEQELLDENGQMKRSFEFRPHYDITLKTPDFSKSLPGEVGWLRHRNVSSTDGSRNTMPSEDSVVTAFTCPYRFCRHLTGIGHLPTRDLRQVITPSTLPLDSLPTSFRGGVSSRESCRSPSDRVSFGLVQKNLIRNLVAILLPSNISSACRHFSSVTYTSITIKMMPGMTWLLRLALRPSWIALWSISIRDAKIRNKAPP